MTMTTPTPYSRGLLSPSSFLNQTGEHNKSLALVLIAKFLTVATFLLLRPDGHLCRGDDNEK